MKYLDAIEGSVYPVYHHFRDYAGVDVIPTAITWSLYDGYNEIVNSREDVAVSVPANEITIVISGDDLIGSSEDYPTFERKLVITATYTDAVLGAGLQLIVEPIKFKIRDVPGVGTDIVYSDYGD